MGMFGYGFAMMEQIQNKDIINEREKSYKRDLIKSIKVLRVKDSCSIDQGKKYIHRIQPNYP